MGIHWRNFEENWQVRTISTDIVYLILVDLLMRKTVDCREKFLVEYNINI